MDEMTQVNRLRSEVPRPDPAELRAEEGRLLSEIAALGAAPPASAAGRARRSESFRRNLRLSLRTSLAMGAGAAMIVGIGGVGTRSPLVPETAVQVAPVSMSAVLQRAADTASQRDELHPEPGQFLVYEMQVMFPVKLKEGGKDVRYLDRSVHKVWLPVEGSPLDGGVMAGEHLEPRPFPGEPLPAEAKRREGGVAPPSKLTGYDVRAEHRRTDYAYLSRLPTDPAGMREHLYRDLARDPLADYTAWGNVGSMITQAYMPSAQRAALFRAAGTIPGVETVAEAEDAAGRRGVAVAMVNRFGGVRHEYIFDSSTYLYLGERVVVVDAAAAGAPEGTLITSTAQLKVEVVDRAPEVAK
ncbi:MULTISPECIES: CU044_5270 family protein [unclassified Streptosporangium]|uniref:CU044_5270 family protein n=1 Tax=unclassified Streptosporangium TaxID=2632669 RepID=UPI002E2819CD|nr:MULTISPECIES: CU044_5270 family protein [unclassified Streptosporangium]